MKTCLFRLFVVVMILRMVQSHYDLFAAPSPIAILKGVEQVRQQYDKMQFDFSTEYINDECFGSIVIASRVVISQGKLRFENFPDSDSHSRFPGSVSLLKDGEVYTYRRVAGNSVNNYDIVTADSRGDVIYDPRLIGLSSIISAKNTVEDCLCYRVYKSVSLIAQEQINGVSVWHLRCSLEKVGSVDFWIEEPSFRVYKKQVELKNLQVIIDSEYESSNVTPFPSVVHIKRFENGKLVFNRNVCNIKVTPKTTILENAFDLSSMNLPVNTSVVDYRIQRIKGYWDGEKLVETPVNMSAQDRRNLETNTRYYQSNEVIRWCMLFSGGILIIVAIATKIRKIRKTKGIN